MRLPPGYHLSAGSWFGRRPAVAARRPPSVPGVEFYEMHRVPLRAPGQSTVDSNGNATVVLAPDGVGTRWYPSQVQVATSSGPTDVSMVTLYQGAVHPTNVIGHSDQGGADTFGVSVPALTPGDLIIAVWANADPGDTVTLIVYGDHEALF